MGRHEPGISSALTAMLVYNLLVTIYLISLGIGGELVGILLWSAIASSREDSISAGVSGLKNLGISLSGMGGSPFEARLENGSWLASQNFTSHRWSVQPCVRPVNAVRMTAGHNALRGSGPGQKPAFCDA